MMVKPYTSIFIQDKCEQFIKENCVFCYKEKQCWLTDNQDYFRICKHFQNRTHL